MSVGERPPGDARPEGSRPALRVDVLLDDHDELIDIAEPGIHLTATRSECARLARLLRSAAESPVGTEEEERARGVELARALDERLVAGSIYFGRLTLAEDLGRAGDEPEGSEFWENVRSLTGVLGAPLLVILVGRGLLALLRDLAALL